MTLEVPIEKNEALERLLKKKCPQGALKTENEAEYIAFANHLQLAIWIRMHGAAPSPSQVDEWQHLFSKNFRQAFEKTIEEDPLYFDGCMTIGDITEEKWEGLESKLMAGIK